MEDSRLPLISRITLTDIVTSNVEVDSKDETYFEWYLQELQKHGYVKEFHRVVSFPVFEGIGYEYECVMKTKTKPGVRFVLTSLSYTPDYVIVWDESAHKIFYLRYDEVSELNNEFDKPSKYPMLAAAEIGSGEIISVIDVKPDMPWGANKFTTSYTFPMKQAMLYQKYGLIVESLKVVPTMKATFTPTRFTLTDGATTVRKLKWEPTTLEAYVKQFADV